MAGEGGRTLRIGGFDVAGDRVFLVDEVIPLLVEADAHSGEVLRVHSWAVDPAQRGRPAGTDVAVVGDAVLVASPAGGGVVRVDLGSGEHQVVALDAPAGNIATDGSLVLVVAGPDWDRPPDTYPFVDAENEDDDISRPVVPRPVWRVDGTEATPVDLLGDVHALAVVDGVAFAVVRRPGDPVIEHARPWGWQSLSYPGAVVRWEPATGASVVAEVEQSSGVIVVDGDRVWLLGFAHKSDPVRELDTTRLTLGRPLPTGTAEPVGVCVCVCGGMLLELDQRRAAGHAGPITGHRLVLRPTSGGRALPGLDLPAVEPLAHNADGAVWFRTRTGPELVCVEATGEVRRVPIDLDCRAHAPPATIPDGLDVDRFETAQVELLRGDLFGTWIDDDGRQYPFIDGVEPVSVDLRLAFPSTQVVVLFRAATHPGVLFGRRWDLYDDLGNPESLDYAELGLKEDVEAAGYGLPPPDASTPDPDGIAWFQP